jgi:hypothetical protein
MSDKKAKKVKEEGIKIIAGEDYRTVFVEGFLVTKSDDINRIIIGSSHTVFPDNIAEKPEIVFKSEIELLMRDRVIRDMINEFTKLLEKGKIKLKKKGGKNVG